MKMLLCAILLLTTSAFAGDVVKRGAAIPPNVKPVLLTSVLSNPGHFKNQTVVIEGVVEKVCWIAGCWMTVAPERSRCVYGTWCRNSSRSSGHASMDS